MVYPLPAVMVSLGNEPEEYNIITISWTGTINSTPPMCYISVRPERYSYEIIKRNMEFVINLTTSNLINETDWCGINSGKDNNKFKEMNLTPVAARIVTAPLIAESPVNIECKINRIIPLGSHHMFIADVVAVNVDAKLKEKYMMNEKFPIADLVSYSNGTYYKQGSEIGNYGFTSAKKK